MCSHGCASTALSFKHSTFSLAIIVSSPAPILHSQTFFHPRCSPFLLIPCYSSWPPSPVLGLIPALPEDVQGLLLGCSPWGAQPVPLPCYPTLLHPLFCLQRSEASSQLIFSAMENALLTFWENYFPIPLQGTVVKLQL